MRGLPTGNRVSDIFFSAKPYILLISPIDAVKDITYIGDISYGDKTMTQKIISKGSKAVVVSQYGSRFETRLYVGARDGLQSAVATLVCGKFKSLQGALPQYTSAGSTDGTHRS
jgi:hypothetical protein